MKFLDISLCYENIFICSFASRSACMCEVLPQIYPRTYCVEYRVRYSFKILRIFLSGVTVGHCDSCNVFVQTGDSYWRPF